MKTRVNFDKLFLDALLLYGFEGYGYRCDVITTCKNEWASLEPEDLPKHIAQHHVLNANDKDWASTRISDDLVTYAAQAYLAGLSP